MAIHRQVACKMLEIYRNYRKVWDHDGTRPDVRLAIARAVTCKTPALGAEHLVSLNGEHRLLPHTCKSRACPSCGYWMSLCWSREVAACLPDLPYTSVVFSIHNTLWDIFRKNRYLLAKLPAIGAKVLAEWSRERFRAEVLILVVPHTFYENIQFYPHLHAIVSRTGLDITGTKLVENIRYYKKDITRRWRYAVVDMLTSEIDSGNIKSDKPVELLHDIVSYERDLWWVELVTDIRNWKKYIGYMARYLRRLPIADGRILPSKPGTVRFYYRNKKEERTRNKALQDKKVWIQPKNFYSRRGRRIYSEVTYSVEEFFALLADQILDHYSHAVHYFGLLAPRSSKHYSGFLRLVGSPKIQRPRRISSADSIERMFGRNPRLDSKGAKMTLERHLRPLIPFTQEGNVRLPRK